jgi:hypothetical protein
MKTKNSTMKRTLGVKSEFFSMDSKRTATIEIGEGGYITTLYEFGDPCKKYTDKAHSLAWWEDCCENWVNYWGDFSE